MLSCPAINSLRSRRLFSSKLFETGALGRIRHELDSPNLGGRLPHHLTICCNLTLKRTKMGIIGPPTALISEAITEPHLPSKEANRLRPVFVAVNFQTARDRLALCERVK
ncbi:hypothetical protein AVEN_119068-1 [Araneus ventricosus]|uniref:Uncharacterized protein n=1 Tax=Araneus ventricosus TaxID=182803 RepID=A0A4Y2BLT3_ARAVE|nr:hypothetical protein AVEN_119068-1 [Araneus ventricosus]